MAKNDFPKPTPAGKYPLGHAKDNGSAEDYTGFKFPEGGGNDIGVYKQPMPNPVAAAKDVTAKSGNPMDTFNIAVGGTNKGNDKGMNKYGEKTMRGYGAATKGIKTRGPMA